MLYEKHLNSLITAHLEELCSTIGSRPVGSQQNLMAEKYIEDTFVKVGLNIEKQRTECPFWKLDSVKLYLDGMKLDVIANTFTPSCSINSPFTPLSSLQELEGCSIKGRIALVYGELFTESLAPKNFEFWNPEKHQKVIRLLEEKAPEAIIGISPRIVHPFPYIEDWDFKIPSVTVPYDTGIVLLNKKEGRISLEISSGMTVSSSANVIGRTNNFSPKRIVICAHYDTKYGTPGASDNATGVSAMLAAAELLCKDRLPVELEFLAFDGEECYALGELEYLKKYETSFNDILAVINIDGIGLKASSNTITFLECSEDFVDNVLRAKSKFPGIVRVDPWYEGDHTLFWPRKVPCIALSSLGVNNILHTELDSLEKVAADKVTEIVELINEIVKLAVGKSGNQ